MDFVHDEHDDDLVYLIYIQMAQDLIQYPYESKIDIINSFVNELKIFVVAQIMIMVNKISRKNIFVKHFVEVLWINYNLQLNDVFDVQTKEYSFLDKNKKRMIRFFIYHAPFDETNNKQNPFQEK